MAKSEDEKIELLTKIRALLDVAEVENRRSPWLGLGFIKQAEELEKQL